MNSDAQVEINMFLRATEMNQANINLGGFFNVNRTLFKSVSILYCWQMSVGISSRPGDIFSSFKKSSSSLSLSRLPSSSTSCQYHPRFIFIFTLYAAAAVVGWMKIKLLATMVTYLVVLLQFQISIPSEEPAVMTTFITKNISYYES